MKILYILRSNSLSPVGIVSLYVFSVPAPQEVKCITATGNAAGVLGAGAGLTQQQQIRTIAKACRTPAVPTTQVRRRKRITPKIFCRHGR